MYNKLYNLLSEGLSGASKAYLKHIKRFKKLYRDSPDNIDVANISYLKAKKVKKAIPQSTTRKKDRDWKNRQKDDAPDYNDWTD